MLLGVSFFLDGFLSNFSIFQTWIPLFSFVSFFLLVPRYYKRPNSFLLFSLIYGCLYDLVYTNQFGFFLFFFPFITLFVLFCYHHFSYRISNFVWQFSLFLLSYQFISGIPFFYYLPQNILFFLFCYPFHKLPIKSLKSHPLFRI